MGHGDHGSRRLGAVLHRLDSPASSLSALLSGLDAAALMTLAAPESGYEVFHDSETAVVAALRTELESMRFKELRQRAKASGLDDGVLEDVADADEPKVALVAILLEQATEQATTTTTSAEAQLLQGLRLKELRKKAKQVGVDEDKLDDAIDAIDAKAAIIALILEAQTLNEAPDSDAQLAKQKQDLMDELSALRFKELRKRAKAYGLDEGQLDDAADCDDPKAAMIELIIVAQLSSASQPSSSVDDIPHFGAKQPRQRKQRTSKGLLPGSKWAMISYQWDDQDRVVAARETLAILGVPCWMDIDGGMQQDIYESMAAGVENAACVVCFMSQKYQDSEK
jgi:hypothetical protein